MIDVDAILLAKAAQREYITGLEIMQNVGWRERLKELVEAELISIGEPTNMDAMQLTLQEAKR